MTYRRWADIKKDHLTPERLEKVTKEVQMLSREIKLRQLREMLNKTQEELAETLGKTQESLSKQESRSDCLLSTLIDYVEALGAHLRLYAEVEGTLYPLLVEPTKVGSGRDDARSLPHPAAMHESVKKAGTRGHRRSRR